MTDFTLHPRLAADTHWLAELELCQVRLMDDARFPWLVLIPRRTGVVEVDDLDDDDQVRLWREATALGHALKHALGGDKLNLATLGNQVPQLHFHVILRRRDDAAWPAPVWGFGEAQPYTDAAGEALRQRLQALTEGLPAEAR